MARSVRTPRWAVVPGQAPAAEDRRGSFRLFQSALTIDRVHYHTVAFTLPGPPKASLASTVSRTVPQLQPRDVHLFL